MNNECINIVDMYKEECGVFYFKTDVDLDNIESLNYFIEELLITSDYFEIDSSDAQAYIRNMETGRYIILDSSGNGDFYNHKIEWYIEDEENL